MNSNKLRKAFDTKYVRIGGFGTIVIAAVVAIAIILNLLVNQLPTSITKLDTSNSNLYEITDQTREIVKGIKDEITIYLVAQTTAIDSVIVEFINRYCAMNSNLKLVKIDPATKPTFTSAYTEDTLTDNSLIVVNERNGRYKIVLTNEIYTTKYSEYEVYMYYMYYGEQLSNPTSFSAENALTSALDYVTVAELPKAYYTSGHGETAIPSELTETFSEENIDLEELALLTSGEIPEDADLILIYNPTIDFTSEEIALLDGFFTSGGNVILLTGYDSGELKNLYSFAAGYGLNHVDGLVVEGSTSNYATYPYYLVPTVKSSDISGRLSAANGYVIMPFAHGITVSETLPENVTVTDLLATSSKAYAKSGLADGASIEKAEGDAEGPFDIAAMSTLKVDSDTSANLIWYSSPYLIDQNLKSSTINYSFFMASVTHSVNKDTSVSIASKSMQVEALSVSESSANLWSVVLIGVLPIGTLVYGFIVWNKRRKA